MGQVTKLLDDFNKLLDIYTEDEKSDILSAARWAEGLHHNQKRASGEPYFIHPLNVAQVLVNLKLDYKSIIAALLHDVLEDTMVTKSELRKEFGKEVMLLVDGVTKIAGLRAKNKTVQASETIRKMLFAMVKDIRVILIKLADKLHNMRTLEYLDPGKQKKIAQECLDIYAPLAARLGISWLKDELEDLSLKYLQPQVYQQIKTFVSGKKSERAVYLERVKEEIYKAAEQEEIKVTLKTRAKHFFSIYYKLKKQGKRLEEIYDLLGIRILCRTQAECYTILGIVHKLWMPISGRFKDYIAMPKSNRYQSLHTTVMCYEGKLIEIQIRTYEMNNTAEYGIAAHWLYKKGFTKERLRVEDIPLINKLKTWDNGNLVTSEFLKEIKQELLKDSIYVFTPRGDVIELPKGASAIDFAYHIHTEVGNHCMASKADGVIIPLRKELKNAQIIEVVTGQNARPHLNWLKYAKTARARAKIRHWLNQNDPGLILEQNIIARNRPSIEKQQDIKKSKQQITTKFFDKNRVGIVVDHERNLLIRFAKCCNATPGDTIAGYISRGRGITIHKKNCPNLKYIKEINDRLIDVEWETFSSKVTRHVKIIARTGTDIFSEIEGAIKKYNGHLIEGKLEEKDYDTISAYFTIEIDKKDDIKKVLKSIRAVPTILNVQLKMTKEQEEDGA
ncbi:MAG: bifunctional (p)ppGpp synthetase/guanosine-3',5'-bis(diphosphate) 3'-pyrophosphohydrolase [Spirochaetales bacterium]|nr:bifunctional (p)ppGpp synthetase/guanosine-3',5'-bis(diphosphate) 3'-pyrophosphohydrolase [Spirochaetales bacterium]